MISRKLMITLPVVAALGAAAAFFLIDFSEKQKARYFPEKMEFRVELHDDEAVRTVQYYPDGLTPMHAIADHKDGKLSEYWYYETGKVREAKTLSAPDEETAKRHLLREAHIAADGVTYQSDVEYFDDGSMWKETRLVGEDRTERRVYYPQSGALQSDQKLSKMRVGWVKTEEKIFSEEGLLTSLFTLLEDGSRVTKAFDETGKVTSIVTWDQYGSRYKEDWLYPDGETVRRQVEQAGDGTEVKENREDGTLKRKLKWAGEIDKSGVLIVWLYNEQEQELFEQYFMFREGRYHIWSISVHRSDGKDLRNIYFDHGSTIPTSDVLYDEGDPKARDRVLRQFDENGFLKETKTWRGAINGLVESFTPKDNIRVTVPDEYLVFPTYENPPQKVPYNPNRGPY